MVDFDLVWWIWFGLVGLDRLVWFGWFGLVNLIGLVENSFVELSLVWFGLLWIDCVKFGLVSQFVQVRLFFLEFGLVSFCCMVWFR